MIPKRIYTSWVGKPGKNIYSETHRRLFMKCMDSWRKFLPDYAVTIVTRENLFDLGENAMVRDWYDRGYFTINWMTPHWLHEAGGVYLDMDYEIVSRQVDDLKGEECYVGRESDGFANAAIVGATKGHPFLSMLLDRLPACDIEEQNEGGPRLYTRVLAEHGWNPSSNEWQRVYVNGRSVLIAPDEVFYPFLWNEPFETRQSKVTANTIGIHHWASSWNQTDTNQKRTDL